jgi:DNA-binding MarR family transcriptional regulator
VFYDFIKVFTFVQTCYQNSLQMNKKDSTICGPFSKLHFCDSADDSFENSIGFLIHSVKQKIKRRMTLLLRCYELTTEQRAILLILEDTGGMTQAKLCETACVEPSNLTVTLRRLEQKSYIEKVDHPIDSRAYIVKPTKKCNEIACELRGLGLQVGNLLLKDISNEELTITMRTLNKMNQNLQ